MKTFGRILVLMMTLIFAVGALAACDNGGSDASQGGGNASQGGGNGGNQTAVKGETQEWGYYKVLVPEGYTLKGGNVLDENDKSKFNLNNNDSALTYFMFGEYDEENAKLSIDTTKEMNEGATDVTATYNGVVWTGVAYESLGYQCFALSADFGDGHFVVVNGAGNTYDADVTNAVLSSLVVNVTE